LPRFQGIFTKVVFLENVRVSLPGNKLISGYCYSEINLFPGNNTRKSIDFRVSCPGKPYEKKTISWIFPRKRKYFRKYSSMWIQDWVLLIHEKNQKSKISCSSLMHRWFWKCETSLFYVGKTHYRPFRWFF